jgi:hypothetical protein
LRLLSSKRAQAASLTLWAACCGSGGPANALRWIFPRIPCSHPSQRLWIQTAKRWAGVCWACFADSVDAGKTFMRDFCRRSIPSQTWTSSSVSCNRSLQAGPRTSFASHSGLTPRFSTIFICTMANRTYWTLRVTCALFEFSKLRVWSCVMVNAVFPRSSVTATGTPTCVVQAFNRNVSVTGTYGGATAGNFTLQVSNDQDTPNRFV